MKRQENILLGVAAAMAVALSVVASAQAPVTLTMRSGETRQVTLVDLKAAGFEVRVNGAEEMIAKDQVAMVDFGGPATVTQAKLQGISSTKHLVVFKNGNTELLNWVDVGGTSPLVLRFDTGDTEREISASDVSRIYLAVPANWTGSVGTAAPRTGGPQPDGSIAVMAADPWTRSGLTVRAGEMLRFAVSGEIHFGNGPDDVGTADGSAAGRGVIARNLPVRTLPIGGLIGRVDNGPAFSIGTAPQPIRMPANGQLFLGINDVAFNDNAGAFRVVITR